MEDLSRYSTEQLKEMLNTPATDTPSNGAGTERNDVPDLSRYSTAELKSMLGKSWRSWLGDVGAAAGSGLVKGAASIPGVAGDIEGLARTGARALGSDTAEETVLPTSAETQRWVGEAVPALQGALNYRPETTAGEYAQTIGEFAPAVLAGGPIKNAAALGRKALTKIVPAAERIAPEIAATSNLPTAGEVATQVIAPAMASEGAGKATEGTWLEPAARLTGAIAGHAGGAGLRNAFGTREGARYAVRNATEGVTPAHLDAMQELIDNAKAQGVDLTRAEALAQVTGGGTSLPNLQRIAEGRGAMAPFFAQRPQQVTGATNRMLDTIAERPEKPELLGPATGKIATDELRKAENAVTAESQPHYLAAGKQYVMPAVVKDAMRVIDNLVRDDTTGLTHPELKKLRGQLENSRNIENLDRIRKNIRDRMALPVGSAEALDKELGAKLSGVMKPVVTAMEERSPAYVKARQVHEQARNAILEPLLAGPIGKLAKTDATTHDAFTALFPAKPIAGSEGTISDAVGRLAAKNPNVARQLVRSFLDTEFAAASKLSSGATNPKAGARFAANVVGNPQSEANLYAALDALHGEPVSDGVRKFMDVLRATGQRQDIGSKSAFNAEMLDQMGSGNATAEVLATLGTGLPRTLRDRFLRWAQGANTDELSRLLTDPRYADKFRELALAAPDTGSWGQAIKSLLAASAKETRILPQVKAHGSVEFFEPERDHRDSGGATAILRTSRMVAKPKPTPRVPKTPKIDKPARKGYESGGAVKRLAGVEKALRVAQKAISEDTKPIMSQPDETVANALRLASGQ